MATPKHYYSHGMTPYAYEWRGIPTPAYQRSHASLGADEPTSSRVVQTALVGVAAYFSAAKFGGKWKMHPMAAAASAAGLMWILTGWQSR